MRTFESAAMGACMLVEDTEDHRRLFGPDGEAVRYFGSREELVDRAGWLLRDEAERSRMGAMAQALVVGGSHSYRDRLTSMLDAFARDTALTFPLVARSFGASHEPGGIRSSSASQRCAGCSSPLDPPGASELGRPR